MNCTITDSDTFPVAVVTLQKGEQIRLERGAMIYHNGMVSLEGKTNSNSGGLGGALKALGRSMVSSESMFITTATGMANDSVIGLAPSAPGSIRALELGVQQWRLNDSAFLACDASASYIMQRQNLGKAIFGKSGGLFVMETQGSGTMLINSYGDILEADMDGNESLVVDNSHVLAWTTGLDYNIRVASGTFGFTTGEGLVNEFKGRGKVLIQTRNVPSLAAMISPYIGSKS